MAKVIRISDAAHARLVAQAVAERRTLTAVVDGLAGVPGPAVVPVTYAADLERLVAVTARPVVPPKARKPNGSVGLEARVASGEDYWAATCQRGTCGHSRRMHVTEGAGRCERCVGTCRAFLEGAG